MGQQVRERVWDDTVKRLLDRKKTPTIGERVWSAVSGRWHFDGTAIPWDGGKRERRELEEMLSLVEGDSGNVVVWVPSPRHPRQRGHIPKCLECGFTVCLEKDTFIAFQSVVIVPRAITRIIASTPTGEYVFLPASRASAWDGSDIDKPTPLS